MKRELSLWQLGGFAAVTLGGTLLHFLYEWTGQSLWAAPFSGVNESTWEHMKLLFFPMFLFALIQRRFFMESRNFWWVKLAGSVAGLVLIPVLFYTYNGAFGKSPDWLNIAIFYLAAATVYLGETWLFRRHVFSDKGTAVALGILCAIGGAFVVFTFLPPDLPLFVDPLTGARGIAL